MLLNEGILPRQLIFKGAKEREELPRLFFGADLVIMPSRTEGFGLTALEALSAGLPVLVSGNSGLGQALKGVPNGENIVLNSEEPRDWARKSRQFEGRRKRYGWRRPESFVKNMLRRTHGKSNVEHL